MAKISAQNRMKLEGKVFLPTYSNFVSLYFNQLEKNKLFLTIELIEIIELIALIDLSGQFWSF